MPYPLSKNETCWISLIAHEKIPKADRPAFQFPIFAGDEEWGFLQEIDEYEACVRSTEAAEMSAALVAKYLKDWRNVKDKDGKAIPFSLEGIRTVLRQSDRAGLLYRLQAYVPTAEDLGFSGSPSPTGGARSAEGDARTA